MTYNSAGDLREGFQPVSDVRDAPGPTSTPRYRTGALRSSNPERRRWFAQIDRLRRCDGLDAGQGEVVGDRELVLRLELEELALVAAPALYLLLASRFWLRQPTTEFESGAGDDVG
jgi:hypothetical protein